MNITITGTRSVSVLPEKAKAMIKSFITSDKDTLIHGGAIGIDTAVGNFAQSIGLKTKVFKPQYEDFPHNPRYAPLARNIVMVQQADVVIGLWQPGSRGTGFTLNKALELGKETWYINIKAQFPRFIKLTKPL